jgi:hypothetical protein
MSMFPARPRQRPYDQQEMLPDAPPGQISSLGTAQPILPIGQPMRTASATTPSRPMAPMQQQPAPQMPVPSTMNAGIVNMRTQANNMMTGRMNQPLQPGVVPTTAAPPAPQEIAMRTASLANQFNLPTETALGIQANPNIAGMRQDAADIQRRVNIGQAMQLSPGQFLSPGRTRPGGLSGITPGASPAPFLMVPQGYQTPQTPFAPFQSRAVGSMPAGAGSEFVGTPMDPRQAQQALDQSPRGIERPITPEQRQRAAESSQYRQDISRAAGQATMQRLNPQAAQAFGDIRQQRADVEARQMEAQPDPMQQAQIGLTQARTASEQALAESRRRAPTQEGPQGRQRYISVPTGGQGGSVVFDSVTGGFIDPQTGQARQGQLNPAAVPGARRLRSQSGRVVFQLPNGSFVDESGKPIQPDGQ